MKTAFVTSWLSSAGGGVSAAVEALSRATDGRGVSVSVLGLSDEAWAIERKHWAGAAVEAFPVTGPRALGLSFGLRRALIALDPDIVHAHGIWMHTSSDVLAWARGRKPYLISPHGMLDPWAVANSSARKRLARLLYEDLHLKRAACIHALCAAEVKAIRAFGLTNPVCIIPNGVHLPKQTSKPPPPWAGQIEDSARVLLFLGRLHPKKNVHGLLAALANIKSQGGLCNWRVVIAGWAQGSYGTELAALVRNLALEKDVVFLGPVRGSRKDAALRSASAFALPSFSEGLPMAVLEAWAYGLPVAMTPACNLPEGFAAGAAHEIRAEFGALSHDLSDFLSWSEADLAAMGQRGRELVRTRFSWERVATMFSAVYDWMLGRADTPACVDVHLCPECACLDGSGKTR